MKIIVRLSHRVEHLVVGVGWVNAQKHKHIPKKKSKKKYEIF